MKSVKSHSTLVTGLLLLSCFGATTTTAFASKGGETGGGGGGYCIENQCMTLAEAGIQIQGGAQNSTWIIPNEVLDELTQITSSLPFGNDALLREALGTPNLFKIVQSIDPKKMKEITQTYQEVIKKNGFNSNHSLEIFAVSSKTRQESCRAYPDACATYLLPRFFDLAPHEQALILIHEANIRNDRFLEQALEFDWLLLKYLNDKSGMSFDYPRFVGSLASSLPWTADHYEKQVSAEVVDYFARKANHPLTLGNFRDTPFSNDLYRVGVIGGNLAYSGRLAVMKSAATVDPRFPTVFSNANMFTIASREGDPIPGSFTEHAFSITADQECRGHENSSGFDKWVLVRQTWGKQLYGIFAADCSSRQAKGTYLGVHIILNSMSLGNL